MNVIKALGTMMIALSCGVVAIAAQTTASKASTAKTSPAPHQVDLSKYPAAVRATIEKAIFLRFGSRQADRDNVA